MQMQIYLQIFLYLQIFKLYLQKKLHMQIYFPTHSQVQVVF